MKLISLIIINLSFSLVSCQTKTAEKELPKNTDCTIYYKKFKEAVVSEQNANALTAIDQAIKCDPNNESFKSNKLRFLIELGKYDDAINLIDKFQSEDNSFKMLKAVLNLKNKRPNALDLLQQSYLGFKAEKKVSSDNLIYKIALTNFFDGKDQALKEIEGSKKEYSDENVMVNLEVVEELIIKYDKENVLFKLFGIPQD